MANCNQFQRAWSQAHSVLRPSPSPDIETTVETTIELTVSHEPGAKGAMSDSWPDDTPVEPSPLRKGPLKINAAPTIATPPTIAAPSMINPPPNQQLDDILGLSRRPSSASSTFSTSAFTDREPKKKPTHLIPFKFLKSIHVPNIKNGHVGSGRTNNRVSKLASEQ